MTGSAVQAPAAAQPAPQARPLPTFREALGLWFRIGCLSFGGPAGQIALLHREVVEERHWVSDRRFLHALNFCTLLPGPEAQQLATYLGWLMHGAKGGFAAGLLFIIPGALVMLVLSILYATLGNVPLIAALFFGLKCAVLVLVIDALLRIGRRALKGSMAWLLAAAAFAALFLFGLSFPLVVLAAASIGYAAPTHFVADAHGKAKDGPVALFDTILAAHPQRAAELADGAWRAGMITMAAWLVPVALLLPLGGLFADVAWFFSKMAVVTFGGAYAVLAYVAQEAVEGYGWLTGPEMLAGLGLAETTPGPLILVLQFVGFLAGYRETGMLGGVAASLLTLWITFAPCFAFIFFGAPLVERLQNNQALSGAMAAITAAVVGVIANLALWFGLRVLFGELVQLHAGPIAVDVPVWSSLHGWAVGLTIIAALCLFRSRLGVLRTLAITAGLGVVTTMIS